MSVQNMIAWIKGHRKAIYVLFTLLIIGLVGSYASMVTYSSSSSDTYTIDEYLSYYNDLIAEQDAILDATPEDYTALVTAAQLYQERAYIYYLNSDYTNYYIDGLTCVNYAEAATAYFPSDFDDYLKSDLYVFIASAYSSLGNYESADETYLIALDLANDNETAIMYYADNLYIQGLYQEAIDALNEYRPYVEDIYLEDIDAFILECETALLTADTEDDTDADTDTDVDAE